MFDIGWSEILVIAVVAIVVVGPKDLPPMLRAFGRTVSKMRRMAGEFQGQFNEALKEAELDDVKKSIDEIRGLNPMNDIRRSLDPMAGPIAKPAPAPVPPPADQLPQAETAADLAPAPSLEAGLSAAQVAALPESADTAPPSALTVPEKPKRVRKPKPATEAEADAAAPAKKPRASRAKSAAAAEAVAVEAKPAKPRARKPKAAADAADTFAAPVATVTAEALPTPTPAAPVTPAETDTPTTSSPDKITT